MRPWKISEADYAERKYWKEYTLAFEDALIETSTGHSPWYVIPSNNKWFRNLAISQIVVEKLESLKMKLPKPQVDISDIRRKYHQAVVEEERK
jgi:polyphosphate kinase 2 (PPK2 family)